ncbi:MFS transporter [Rhodococcus rhodochrous]|uniref:MFS transporter n=1 Tax=Rhodococcus rhodochrous TaxID=1829 RepID=UPI0027E36AA5|nr:MFS transporter [Rhodococcus rhodochrous]
MTRNDTPVSVSQGNVPLRISGALATGVVLQPLNSSMIAVGLVSLAAAFGSDVGISWIISAMYVTTAVTAPMAGRLGTLLGARPVYLSGLLLVIAGSIVGMFAPSLTWLIVAYAILGAGISAHLPTAMTMVRSFAERNRRDSRTALTVLVLCGQTTAAMGPTLGGLLVGAFGWQTLLWVNIPVALLSAVAVMTVDTKPVENVAKSAREMLRVLDLSGVGLFLVAVTALMLLLVSIRSTPLWWLLPIVLAASVLFVLRERSAEEPFIDVRELARNRALSWTLGRTLLTQTCIYCFFFGIPQWLQYSRGMTPIETGLTMLPVAGVAVMSTMIGSFTLRRFGVRATLVAGTLALLAGGVLIAVVEKSTAPIVVLLVVSAVLGIPNGLNNLGNQSLVNASTTVEDVGTAIGMYRTVQFIGTNLAVVVLQIAAGQEIDDDGLHNTGWFITGVSVVLLVGVVASRHMPQAVATARQAAID